MLSRNAVVPGLDRGRTACLRKGYSGGEGNSFKRSESAAFQRQLAGSPSKERNLRSPLFNLRLEPTKPVRDTPLTATLYSVMEHELNKKSRVMEIVFFPTSCWKSQNCLKVRMGHGTCPRVPLLKMNGPFCYDFSFRGDKDPGGVIGLQKFSSFFQSQDETGRGKAVGYEAIPGNHCHGG